MLYDLQLCIFIQSFALLTLFRNLIVWKNQRKLLPVLKRNTNNRGTGGRKVDNMNNAAIDTNIDIFIYLQFSI